MLLYADDTVVFGTDEKEFQNNLDMFYEYSELWHLSVNFDKTKIMIFGTRLDQRFNFNLGGHKIDICIDFKYLGVIFSRNRHFHQPKFCKKGYFSNIVRFVYSRMEWES